MKSVYFILLILSSAFAAADAQPGKEVSTIGILPFKHGSGDEADAAKQAENLTYEILVNSKRMNIVDREIYRELENEDWRQSKDNIKEDVIEKTKEKGGEFFLIGEVTSFDVERLDDDKGSYNYYGNISIGVRIVDVETSEVAFSDTWESPRRNTFKPETWIVSNTESAAVEKAVKKLEKEIQEFLDEYSPIQGSILEVTQERGGQARVVMFGLGSEDGVQEKGQFTVVEVKERKAGGRTMKYTVEVGELKVTEVNGAHIATADVKKGGKEILDKYNEGANLLARTKR